MSFRSVVDQDFAFVIVNCCIESGLCVNTVVGDGCISRGHLKVCDTVGDTAESKRLSNISVDLTACGLHAVYQSSESKVQQIIKAGLRSDIGKYLYGNYVHGLSDRLADRYCSPVSAVPVLDRTSVIVVERGVLKSGCKSISVSVDSRCVGGKYLKTGTGLSCGVSCTVQSKASGFLSTSAADGFYFAGVLIHDHDAGLRFGTCGEVLHNFVALFEDGSLVLVHGSLSFLR